MTLKTKQRLCYSPFDSNRETVKPAGMFPIVAFVIAEAIFLYVANVIIFPLHIWKTIFSMTGGLVYPTLVINLAGIVIIGFGVILFFGRLKKEDIGLRWNLLPQAALITGLVWIVAQLIGAMANFSTSGKVVFEASWSQYGLLEMLGLLIGQLFGNSFLEEIAFRGFLLPQLYFKVTGHWLNRHKWTRLVIVILVSQAIFVLMHIPNRLGQGLTPLEWIVDFSNVFILGILFALIYLRTGNLFLAVGIHAFIDAPESLFISGDISKWFFVVFGIIIVVFWPRIKRTRLFSIQEESVADANNIISLRSDPR